MCGQRRPRTHSITAGEWPGNTRRLQERRRRTSGARSPRRRQVTLPPRPQWRRWRPRWRQTGSGPGYNQTAPWRCARGCCWAPRGGACRLRVCVGREGQGCKSCRAPGTFHWPVARPALRRGARAAGRRPLRSPPPGRHVRLGGLEFSAQLQQPRRAQRLPQLRQQVLLCSSVE